MAEPRINLNNYKSSGVYTVEIDASENIVLPLTTGRLIVGSSRVGPFNTVVLINDLRTLRAVFGEIDPKLEKAGSYFHRTIEVALREGPVFAMNVLPLDTYIAPSNPASSNLDNAAFTTFNTESASNNNEPGDTYPIVEFFNRQRLWFADSEKLNKSKNLALLDDYITNPGGFGISNAESNKILSFANLGQSNMTVWVRKANVNGFDVTAREWYASVGGSSTEFPAFVHNDDFISDYFVEVIVINGDWSNYLKLSKDPIYKQFFDESGLKSANSANFFALREIKVINRTIGCLIPDFRDQSGITVSIDRLVNRAFPTTGLLCALDADKLDLIDFTEDTFDDTDVHTHRIDTVGHGLRELANYADNGGFDNIYIGGVTPAGFIADGLGTGYTTATGVLTTSAGGGTLLTVDITDDGAGGILSIVVNNPGTGYEIGDTVTINGGVILETLTITGVTYANPAIDPTPLIDTLSYMRPVDSELVFEIDSTIAEVTFLAGTGVAVADQYIITAATDYIVAMEGSKAYEAYTNGFLKTGDTIIGLASTLYVKVVDSLTVGLLKYIRIETYSDIALTTQVGANTYTALGTDYFKVVLDSGDDFKQVFDLADPVFFAGYSVAQPNILTLELANPILAADKALIDKYIKVNSYIKANVTDGRDRLLKIISVTSSTNILTSAITYTVTTMAPSVDEVTGLEVIGTEIQLYLGITNFVTNLKGQKLTAFKLRPDVLPNGTAERLEGTGGILDYLFTDTLIPQALANGELVDFRYVVDTYSGTISSSSKYQLAKLAALNGQAMALLNAPSMQQFEKSVDPSFIDTTNKLVSTELIAAGGNLALNPSFLYKFAEEDVKGVPLSSYASYHFPNLIVRSGSKNVSVPQAGYISNLYVRKFKNGTPFLIVAGGKRGALSDPEIVGLEYDLTDDDRDFLEPAGFNLTVKRRGFGIILFSNNTAYQRINSALNNAHVRDNLSTIERDLEKILFNFLFDFNDEITRLRVRTIVENYLNAVINAKGISTYEVIFDTSNNTTEVISANAAIIDIRIDFPRGIQKFINRITITRVGGSLSSDSTGFIPSF